jgi:thioredoxin 2
MANVTLACQFCQTLNKIDPARHADRPKCAECGRPFLLDRPVKVLEEHFDQTVLKAEVPVVVDFYADWCGPCKMMAPLVDEIANEQAGKVLVAKVDTDASPKVSQRYNIKGIPFFARFENGELVKQAVGAVSREELQELAADPAN